MNNKFTILTSGYNKAKYLIDWSNSILAQRYRPLEVVFADDYSTDNTKHILVEIAKKFKNEEIEFLPIFNKKRLYCGSSYNNLVNYATGSFFGVLDGDDMLVHDAVEYIMQLYKERFDITWIYTQFMVCDVKMIKRRKGFCRCPGKKESLLSLGDRGIHGYGHWRTFNYKIEKKDKLFGKEMKCAVDKYMGYRLEEFGKGMFVDRICYKYRQYPVNSKEGVSTTKYAMDMWKEVIKKVHTRRKKYNYQPYSIIKYGK